MGEVFSHLMYGFSIALTPDNLTAAFFGGILGLFVGALPGIGSVMGVALLLPLTFKMEPTTALIMLAALYYSTMYAGAFTAILLNIPGDSSAIITSIDGYQLTKQGKAGKALAVSNMSSFIAGFIGVALLTIMGPALADVGLAFGPAEMTSVIILAIATIAWMLGEEPLKGLLATCIGMLLATVGMDLSVGMPRFAFGIGELFNGIDFIALVIGFMGVTEIVKMGLLKGEYSLTTSEKLTLRSNYLNWMEMKQIFRPSVLYSISGSLLGVIPGAGATTASFLAYVFEKRTGKNKENMGKGALEGVAAPEAANNAAAAGCFAPLLSLGIPGSGTTAILLSGLMMWGITPGPMLFTEHPEIAWGLIASMYTGNVICMIIAALSIPLIVRVLRVPAQLLAPVVVVICIVSSYAASNSLFGVWIMLGIGVMGYFFNLYNYPVAPFLLSFILTPRLEVSIRQAFDISNGDPMVFVEKPISLLFLVITAMLFIVPPIIKMFRARKAKDDDNNAPA